ncbi:MAG TPA: hypothetical protein VE201_05970 [Nitrospirales bacterium]|nr:hypothetical protein [Nitrospirales bacterium]
MISGRLFPIWFLSLPVLLLGAGAVLAADAPAAPAAAAAPSYEVWVIDQSDSSKDGGGTLYIYDGAALASDAKSAKAETIDLGDKFAEACKEAGGYPKRPHMIFFTKDGKYGILSYVASGHVVFLDAAVRAPIGCVSLGKNAHAAFPAADMKLAIGANIAEKKLVRIWTDYANKKFTVNPSTDVVALATLESGGALPDMAPICPIIEKKSQFVFVTPRGGGLAIFDITTTPMSNTGSLPKDSVRPAGCGGVQIGSTMYLNSGGGWPATPLNHDVYAFGLGSLPEVSVPERIGGRDGGDSHGMVSLNNKYLWSGDRHLNLIDAYDTGNGNIKVGTILLSGDLSKDPAPDLMDAAPDSNYVFTALRGPSPLTGNNKDVNNAVGSTPGVGVIKVEGNGRGGALVGIAPISKKVQEKDKEGKDVTVEKADPHGIQVRKK